MISKTVTASESTRHRLEPRGDSGVSHRDEAFKWYWFDTLVTQRIRPHVFTTWHVRKRLPAAYPHDAHSSSNASSDIAVIS